MAIAKQNLATSQSLAISSSGITLANGSVGLANGAGRGSILIDNSTALAVSADIYIKVKTGAAGVSATGYLDVYLIRNEDGSNTVSEDGFAGTTTVDAAFVPVNATKIGIISAVAIATTYYAVLNTAMFGELPRRFAIGIVNNTGASLDITASNHTVSYTLKNFTIA